MISALRLTLRATDVVARYFSFAERKVTKGNARRPRAGATHRFPALLGPSRDGAGTRYAQTAAPLRPRRPAVLGSLEGGLNGSSVDPRHAWMLLLLLYLVFSSRLARARSVRGQAGGDCGCPPHGPEACSGGLGRTPNPGLAVCAGQRKHASAAKPTRTYLRRPRNPHSPDPPHDRLSAANRNAFPYAPTHTLGHPACRPC